MVNKELKMMNISAIYWCYRCQLISAFLIPYFLIYCISDKRDLRKMTLTWEEPEVAALDRQEWRQSMAQCIHLDAGWIKVRVNLRQRKCRAHFSIVSLISSASCCCTFMQCFLVHYNWNWRRTKRKALRQPRKTDIEGVDVICWGRLFQYVAAAIK